MLQYDQVQQIVILIKLVSYKHHRKPLLQKGFVIVMMYFNNLATIAQ